MTERIFRYLREQQPETPCLVVDLDVVENNFRRMRELLPAAHIFYAVKANPAAQILARLATAGSKFDTASRGEIELVQAAGVAVDRISFGNTIKKEKDIAWAYQQGVRLFAFDSEAELQKLVRVAPGAQACSAACWSIAAAPSGRSARSSAARRRWPRTCCARPRTGGSMPTASPSMSAASRPTSSSGTGRSGQVSQMFFALAEEGVDLRMVNLGGGFPARYRAEVNGIEAYCEAVTRALVRHFGNRMPEVIIEPGRSMVGDAGVIQSEVVLVSRKAANDRKRWVYLDIGKFSGLAETMDESIKYRLRTSRDGTRVGPVVLAGPTCDSADILYEKTEYKLPLSLKPGDKVEILSTGAYTTTYSSVAFNGFPPLKAICI